MFARSIKLAFENVSRKSARSLHNSVLLCHPRSFRQEVSSEKTSQDDIDTIAEIESNLFEASSNKSNKAVLHSFNNLVESDPPVKRLVKKISAKREPVSSAVVKDSELGLTYKKLSLNDPLVSKLMMMAKSKKARDKKQQIVIEGRRLILDAISAGLRIDAVLFAQKQHLMDIHKELKRCKDIQIFRIPQQDLQSWSTLVTCPGVIAICQKPTMKEVENALAKRPTFPITVICDNIREPNNLGSIIRTCAAIPCQNILVIKGCCDPWDTKALRGGCGAQFNMAIQDDLTWDEVETRLVPPGDEISPQMYIAESNSNISKTFKVNTIDYDQIHIAKGRHCLALVIGGETHGVSEDAYKLLKKFNESSVSSAGACLHIPMSPYVESLNTASAITLILFEIRKKLQQSFKTIESHIQNSE